jgi:hypothetical protein
MATVSSRELQCSSCLPWPTQPVPYAHAGSDEEPPPAKNKRKAGEPAAGSREAKTARQEDGLAPPGPPGQCWSLGMYSDKFATINTFKGQKRVDLRQYYEVSALDWH